jgi:hypothetical protein
MGVIKLIIVMLAILNELDFNFLNDGTYNLNEFNILYVVVTSWLCGCDFVSKLWLLD